MIDYTFSALNLTNEEVLSLNEDQALKRLDALIQEAYDIYNFGIEEYITKDKKKRSYTFALFSGGSDSTILLYLFKDIADYALHIRTGIGLDETYEYVVDTCNKFNIPIKTYSPDEQNTYENLIKVYGFPGPSQHFLMYQRLKERSLRKAVKENNIPKKERIVFLSGKRRDESVRRMLSPEFERNRSVVWISPIVNWTKADINLFRKLNPDIPRSFVSDMIHMSGECLCGAFAKVGEREQLKLFFPEFDQRLSALENMVNEESECPLERRVWGWGVGRKNRKRNKKIGDLCSTCEYNNDDNKY